MKIEIISLERDLKRRCRCLMLQKQNQQINIFNAIDCKNTEQIKKLCEDNKIISRLSPHNACTLSHITILKNFIKSDQPYIIILEDDCILLQNLPNCDNDIDNMLKDINTDYENTDILYLTERIHFNKNYEVTHAIGTEGYIVTKHGAEKIIEATYYEEIPIDWIIEAYCVYGRQSIRDRINNRKPHIKIRAFKSKTPFVTCDFTLESNIIG